MEDKVTQYIIDKLLMGEENLKRLKVEAARKFSSNDIIKNTKILENFPKEKLTDKIRELLLKKPMRTGSGVTPIAVMIQPEDSCKWACIYCPFTGKAAKSYTGYEPAARRARDNGFDPVKQVKTRLSQFSMGGHKTEKCEVIIMGGTFLDMKNDYKNAFVNGIYDALNNKKSKDILEAKKINEKEKHRMVGLTIETRPDCCVEYIDQMLEYGVTRVELGVQNPDDVVYKKINRGHGVKEVVDSTEKLKNCGFKVCYHLMPGLPGSNKKKDIDMIKKIFEDQRFRPDMLKIYPTLVIEGTVLANMVKTGKYKPYNSEEAAEVISEFYRYIPKYTRVMRIQRDIPATYIKEGVKKSNLREMVEQKIKSKGIEMREIRAREMGLRNEETKLKELELKRERYEASGGEELFISYEKNNTLAGFIRLRIPNRSYRKEIDNETALIRELHVYGSEVGISEEGTIQHIGIGTKLLKEAEKIAKKEFKKKKMIIISGVGVREYYRKRGYKLVGPYMQKEL